MYYDIIYIQITHPWTGENKNGRWYVCKVLLRAGILFLDEGDSFSYCLQTLCSSFSTSIPPSSSSLPLSEPPEAYIDNEHDEKDTAGCQLGIGGAGVQILGVAPVLL